VDYELADELIQMSDRDHEAQHLANSSDVAERLTWRGITTRNGDRLDEIMTAQGWPTAAMVGEEAATRAWLIAQHADRQLSVQRKALALMELAVADGESSPRELAFLRDRVLVNEGRPQIYGTQIADVQNGVPIPWPCQDPEFMDKRRAEVGIESFGVHTGRYLN
jgi:hypothetical protein